MPINLRPLSPAHPSGNRVVSRPPRRVAVGQPTPDGFFCHSRSVRSLERRFGNLTPRRHAYAHTPNGQGDWHLLVDHLRGTAEPAAAFADPFGAAELARTAGWLHDAGKCSDTFSAYLRACDADGNAAARRAFPVGTRDHKRPGALRASQIDGYLGPLLATMILGHHGGARPGDCPEPPRRGRRGSRCCGDSRQIRPAGDRPAVQLSTAGPQWLREPPNGKAAQEAFVRDVEMLGRLVYSALVDADFLDTEAHFKSGQPRREERPLDGLRERFEDGRRSILARATHTPVNVARSQMYDAVLATAGRPPGLYSLAAPTGAGKTLIGLGWALAHADAHGLRRIVTAVPFITRFPLDPPAG